MQNPAFPGRSDLAGSIDVLRSHTDTSLTRDFVVGFALHVWDVHRWGLFVEEQERGPIDYNDDIISRITLFWGHFRRLSIYPNAMLQIHVM